MNRAVISTTTVAVLGISGLLILAGGAGFARLAANEKARGPELVPMQPEKKPADAPGAKDPSYVLGYKVKDIDGKEQDLSQYKGKVLVIVNVASKCGFTPQYEGLEKLYEDKKDKGLVVLGFPANNFGSQEPGSNSEIKDFCTSTYHVTFPLFEKISVKGPDQHELYKNLTGQPKPIGGDPKWNFTKFVVDRSGKVVARFDAQKEYVRTDKLEPDLIKKVDELLAKK
jgi:glutathione peroxidase